MIDRTVLRAYYSIANLYLLRLFELNKRESYISLNDIEDFVIRLVTKSPLNSLRPVDIGQIFDMPFIGIAVGRDPLFTEYKRIIGNFHLTPEEILESTSSTQSNNIRVVCWVLPFSEPIKRSNAKYNEWPPSSNDTTSGNLYYDAMRRVYNIIAKG